MQTCLIENTVVSVDELNAFTNNYSDTKDDTQMKVRMLSSAQQVVEEYLGYSLNPGHHIETHIGINQSNIYLNAMPVTNVWRVVINGEEVNCFEHGISSVHLFKRIKDGDVVVIEYDTGYTPIPDLIKTTILRIAALMLTEANNNIGITSKSFGDNTRTFQNLTDYSKYLAPASMYRIFRM